MKLTDVAVAGEPIKQSIMVQRLEINFSEETKEFLLKALQAEPRSASRWIDADLDPNFAKCKNCSENKVDIAYSKDFIKQEKWNFCPNCGAKMDKEIEE